jgi:hypothetical protein
MHRVTSALRTSAPAHRRPAAPVHTPDAPATPPRAPAVHAPAPRRPAGRTTKATNTTLGQQWGKLTDERSRGTVWGLRTLAFLIVVALVGVVVAPPALSAHDIISWAQSHSVDSGLGLSEGWAWVTFLALDFAAGVCVLICVYCAIVNTKPGVFALYVWAFAGATAYANWSFGGRPGAPGDAQWFFPTMSIVGPLLLHSVLVFLRSRIKGAQGNKRGQRPSFPLVDWLPVVGTPQDTYGAWRTAAMLGIEVPDAALWAYRAVSLDANWARRWFVKGLVRTEQIRAFRARLEDPTVALAIPGLLPEGAFAALVSATDTDTGSAPGQQSHPDALPGAPAPVHWDANAPAGAAALDGAPESGTVAAGAVHDAPVQGSAPGAPVRTDAPVSGAPVGASIVSLDGAAWHSAEVALDRIFERYATRSDWTSWDQLIANVSLNRIERELGMGKRRVTKAFAHAEDVLPWTTARADIKHQEAQ